MKLKSSQLSHNVAVLIENYNQNLRIYFADGHYEIVHVNARDLEHIHIKNYKYKNPVCFGSALLFPTQNQRERECKWVNLEYLSEEDAAFMTLLKDKNLEGTIQKMYNQYIQKILF